MDDAISAADANRGFSSLLRRVREGRSIVYSADYPAMTALLGYLTENCCAGNACAAADVAECPPTATHERNVA